MTCNGGPCPVSKPVIYLYTEKPIDVTINLKINKSKFTTVYPKFTSKNEWKLKANPNDEIIIDNLNNIQMQNQVMDYNDRLFEQANFDTQNRYERDAYINAFFGSNL
jgi:hypothetical protein